MAKRSQTRIIAMAVLIGSLAASPASACLFCKGGTLSIDKPLSKGGTLSIDKPLSKGGTLSIDKPLNFSSKPIANVERGANDFLRRAIAAATELLQKLVVWLGIAFTVVFGLVLVMAMGLASLILRRNRSQVVENSSTH